MEFRIQNIKLFLIRFFASIKWPKKKKGKKMANRGERKVILLSKSCGYNTIPLGIFVILF